jgi:ABC-type multidrug transport system ATPase subunit
LLLRPPELLLLDEPYSSFDVDGIERVNAFARRVADAGGIALVATHDLRRAEPILDRETRLENGRVATGPLDDDANLVTAGEGQS